MLQACAPRATVAVHLWGEVTLEASQLRLTARSVREYVLQSIEHALNDIDRFFLINAGRAADVRAEAYQLAHAEARLGVTAQQFDIARAAPIVDEDGGPGDARIAG